MKLWRWHIGTCTCEMCGIWGGCVWQGQRAKRCATGNVGSAGGLGLRRWYGVQLAEGLLCDCKDSDLACFVYVAPAGVNESVQF